jgi:two-component system, LytTR family, response regulator
MHPLKAYIVDDEAHARENLKMLLDEFCPEIKVIASAGSVSEAEAGIRELNPDVVFLDIRMPSGAEGFELLKSLKDIPFQVVFVTAFKDYAIRAFHANAIHYILKPIDIEDLQHAAHKLAEIHAQFAEDGTQQSTYLESIHQLGETLKSTTGPRKITLYHSKGFRIVEDNKIIRLEADGNCTQFHFANQERYLDTKTLKVFEDMLNPEKFCRIHKSHIINLDHLVEYRNTEGPMAIMDNGDEVPISRSKLSVFLTMARNL